MSFSITTVWFLLYVGMSVLYYDAVSMFCQNSTIKYFKAVVTKSGESDRSISEEKAQVGFPHFFPINLVS